MTRVSNKSAVINGLMDQRSCWNIDAAGKLKGQLADLQGDVLFKADNQNDLEARENSRHYLKAATQVNQAYALLIAYLQCDQRDVQE
jgi:hypothetical protein